MMWWYHTSMAMLPIGLLILLILAASAALIVLAVRHTGTPPPLTRSAEQILADRYARGDIDESEYLHRLEVLRRS